MDMFNDKQQILNYRFDKHSIYDLSDCLKLDHSTFCSCALSAVLQLMIVLQLCPAGSFHSAIDV